MLVPLMFALVQTVQGPVGARLDSIANAEAAKGFHGSVLVAQGGRTLLEKGYGIANHATGSRYTPATLVQIGSNVKDMTKVAIFQLVEAGRISVTDSLAKFFPGVPADKRGITIDMLLHHRAGLPLGLGGGDDRGVTREQLLQETFALQLGSAPGTAERYSNTGYALLAAIVEQVTGQPFDRYVAERILRPAGMMHTGAFLPHFDPANIAHGYSGDENTDHGIILDKPHDATGHLYQLRGNGGYLSTPDDMLKFYHAVLGDALLRDPAHRRAVLPDGPGVQAGSDLVSFFLYGTFPGAGVEIVIATNHAGYRGNRLMQQLLPALGIQDGGGDGPRVATTGAAPTMTSLPDDGAGRTVAAYLEAYNTGDTAAVRRFFAERVVPNPNAPPMEVRLQRFRDMYANLGRLTVRGVRAAPDGGLVVMVNGASGEQATLTFLIEPQAPFRVLGIRVEVG